MQESIARKCFNVTGPCIPGRDYMVDTTPLIQTIIHDYVEQGKYFVINRARQYGKTTTLFLLKEMLEQDYIVLRLSFEGSEEFFVSLTSMANGIRYTLVDALEHENLQELQNVLEPHIDTAVPMRDLRKRIERICKEANKPVVLIIDEVDRASDFDVFKAFLGMLRDMYIMRSQGVGAFQSVILAGVHDIKNLKAKIRPDSEHTYNSPWNIAAEFTLDMSFSIEQIAVMLIDYEVDHHTGMDIPALAKTLHEQTSGYPFLVSVLCKRLDEVTHDWTVAGLHAAVAHLLSTTNTLFDDIIKNIENNKEFRLLVEALLLRGERIAYVSSDTRISLGVMFGILMGDDAGQVRVSNRIFEQYIYNHFVSMRRTKYRFQSGILESSAYVHNGLLNMQHVIKRFSDMIKSEYRVSSERFIEEQGRLLFLIFLKPIINGVGHYAVEPETRDSTRMDIVVFYGREEHIVELKIWHGQKKEKEAYSQLSGYLNARGQRRGYLISFCNLKNLPKRGEWIEYGDCMIYEEIVSYSSDVEG